MKMIWSSIFIYHKHCCSKQKGFGGYINICRKFNFESAQVGKCFSPTSSPFLWYFSKSYSSLVFNWEWYLTTTAYLKTKVLDFTIDKKFPSILCILRDNMVQKCHKSFHLCNPKLPNAFSNSILVFHEFFLGTCLHETLPEAKIA